LDTVPPWNRHMEDCRRAFPKQTQEILHTSERANLWLQL
jgi:hypothetical protein